tara:strand:- start:5919 stop:6995 length:1077 start_codon:yes stop_codon:yes gene_type:complete
MSKKRVLIGLSGGVDSSVAAHLLKEQGYAVDALFMKNWNDDDGSPYCSIKEDFMDASFVADQLNIKLVQENFSEQYKTKVFNYFLRELKRGRTPNPDILCNREIKFDVFYNYAMEKGYDFIATGHYAQIKNINKRLALYKGVDNNKDQSYFLYSVPKSTYSKILFPLGSLYKKDVRAIAKDIHLVTSNKKDSTGICFIGERPFPEFLSEYIASEKGDIIDSNNKQIGTHNGLPFYTLGQRKGLGIGGMKDSNNNPWYVAEKDLENNTLKVVQGNCNKLLMSKELLIKNLETHHALTDDTKYSVKVRYRQADQDCVIKKEDSQYRVLFDKSQRAITPGQSAVIYKDNECIGGGEIDSIN